MNLRRLLLPLLTLLPLLAAGCTVFAPNAGAVAHYRGTAIRVCSPVDAIGHELRLARQAGDGPPLVVITIWSRKQYEDGAVIRLSGAYDQGQLYECADEQDCRAVGLAHVELESGLQSGAVTGRFWSRADGPRGTFQTEPAGDPPICG